MNSMHESEETLQEYALDPASCEVKVARHIQTCSECMASVTVYRRVFTAVANMPPANPRFDVSDVVLQALADAPVEAENSALPYWVYVLVAAAVIIPGYLFRENFVNLLGGISGVFLYLMTGSALMLIIFQANSWIKKYQRQWQMLNKSSALQHHA